MRSFFTLLFGSLFPLFTSNAQTIDIHSHSSMKHFYSTVKSAKAVEVDSSGLLKDGLSFANWKRKPPVINYSSVASYDSHLKNYFQSTFGDQKDGKYTIAVHTISTPELNLFYNKHGFIRRYSRKQGIKITQMNPQRFQNLLNSSPFDEAISEERFLTNQANSKTNKIIFPKDTITYKQYKDSVNYMIGVLAFEGGHQFFDKKIIEGWKFGEKIEGSLVNDVFSNVLYFKKSPTPIFFFTLAHLTWNTLIGYSKSMDKPKKRGSLVFFSKSIFARKQLFAKWGSGLPVQNNYGRGVGIGNHSCDKNNYKVKKALVFKSNADHRSDNSYFTREPKVNNLGLKVIEKLLSPQDSLKPIYIDVKHMDVKSRLDYYILRDSLQKKYNIKIPIIYSHGAASGKKLKVAHYTSVSPIFDRYQELKDPCKYYSLRPSTNFNRAILGKSNCSLKLDYFDKYHFKFPILFRDSSIYNPEITAFDLKLEESKNNSNTVGWFYPWNLNLFDEEIEEIYNSDGIIGLIADERVLGKDLPNYKNEKNATIQKLIDSCGYQLADMKPAPNQFSKIDSFLISEPFLRNMFYIAQHSGRKGPEAWNHLAFGSDFDGFINPIDICPTAAHVPYFREYLVKVIRTFLKIHPEFWIEDDKYGMLYGLKPEEIIHKIFYENSERFIEKYWAKTVPLNP